MKTKLKMWQQGDVLGKPLAELPAGLVPVKKDKRGVVLAEGEHTGHYHGIEDGGVQLLEHPETKTRYLVNSSDKPATLKHQEHNPITVNPGIFEIGIVREVDHLTGMVAPVVD